MNVSRKYCGGLHEEHLTKTTEKKVVLEGVTTFQSNPDKQMDY
jgi:hypothetical protein